MGLRTARTFATIDIGSNGVRLFVARRQGLKSMVLADQREPIRLGEDSFRNGQISPATLSRLTSCFLEFRKQAHKLGAFHIRAAATSALRDAKNGAQVVQEIWRRTGITIERIDGLEEARLLHLAVSRSLPLGNRKTLMFDLGGGSLETVISQGPKIHHALSLKLGTVRLLERFGADAKYSSYAPLVRRELDRIVMSCEPLTDLILPQQLVGTGGCIRAMAKLAAQFNRRPITNRMTIDEVEELTDVLFALTLRQRTIRLGLKRNRADVIRPAAVIVQEIMRAFNFDRIQVPNVGIKNGLFWQLSDSVLT